ncbi:MAG: nucleoside phosphorylase [Saprospiraceae bacterium]|nr:nucleoside phosphorylase [Saprospiraceae bacterium]
MIGEADLILNPDGSIYHLGLTSDQICEDIILVGDPDRVKMFEPYMERIFFTQHVREFVSMMGEYKGKNILVISTGIGTDNIDIVFTELDALVNIDLTTRKPKSKKTKLNFYRIGTSGSLRKEIPVDGLLASTHGIGLDVLMHFYERKSNADCESIRLDINKILKKERILSVSYAATASSALLKKVPKSFHKGMTLTLPGFYGPQGRNVRIQNKSDRFLELMRSYAFGKHVITNFEMETSAIYGMAETMGHRAISLNAIIANRELNVFSSQAKKTITKLIEEGLEMIVSP